MLEWSSSSSFDNITTAKVESPLKKSLLSSRLRELIIEVSGLSTPLPPLSFLNGLLYLKRGLEDYNHLLAL